MMKATVSRRSTMIGAVRWAHWVRPARQDPARAQGGVMLRWWSTRSVPAQLEAYKFQIAQFEAANPGIEVFEATSNETYAAQLAAFADGQCRTSSPHLPSFAVTNYWRNGLLEPFNDVIQMVGPEKFILTPTASMRSRRASMAAPASACLPRPPRCAAHRT